MNGTAAYWDAVAKDAEVKPEDKFAFAQTEFAAALTEHQANLAESVSLTEQTAKNASAVHVSTSRLAAAREALFKAALPSNVIYHSPALQGVTTPKE